MPSLEETLSTILGKANKVQSEDFIKLVEETAQLIDKEQGKIGNLDIVGRLVKVKPLGEALIASDLHGDLESLLQILRQSNFLQKANQDSNNILVFLGDYGDRGLHSPEVYYVVLRLKLLFPKQIILMRGNHEGPDDLLASPHDLPVQFEARFGQKWRSAYSKIRELFAHLYNAVIVEDRYLMIHGGLSTMMRSMEDLAYAHIRHPKQRLFEEMLWSDPTEMIKGSCESPRGAGKLFGEHVTNEVLRRFNVKMLIRGHEPCTQGFKIDHRGKILTLFSRRGPPYFNNQGAYLTVELSEIFLNAEQLAPHIRKIR